MQYAAMRTLQDRNRTLAVSVSVSAPCCRRAQGDAQGLDDKNRLHLPFILLQTAPRTEVNIKVRLTHRWGALPVASVPSRLQMTAGRDRVYVDCSNQFEVHEDLVLLSEMCSGVGIARMLAVIPEEVRGPVSAVLERTAALATPSAASPLRPSAAAAGAAAAAEGAAGDASPPAGPQPGSSGGVLSYAVQPPGRPRLGPARAPSMELLGGSPQASAPLPAADSAATNKRHKGAPAAAPDARVSLHGSLCLASHRSACAGHGVRLVGPVTRCGLRDRLRLSAVAV